MVKRPDNPFFLPGFQPPFCFTSASSSQIMLRTRGCITRRVRSGSRTQIWMSSFLETQGQIVGARESLNGRKNVARRKVKNWSGETLSPEALLAVLYLLFFVPYIFFRPFRLSLTPFICPWVSEDGMSLRKVKSWPFIHSKENDSFSHLESTYLLIF